MYQVASRFFLQIITLFEYELFIVSQILNQANENSRQHKTN